MALKGRIWTPILNRVDICNKMLGRASATSDCNSCNSRIRSEAGF